MAEKITLKKKPGWGEEVFSLLSWFNADKVKNAKVMVVGAGALGNEVLKNLALFGVGNIVVVDYDTIEYSNLSRSVLFREEDARNKGAKVYAAAKRIKEINPEVNIIPVYGNIGPDVGLGLFRRMDVIIGCLDSRYARFLVNQHSFRANKSWVDGGIENLEGYARVFNPGLNCYECNLSEEELKILRLRTGCPDIAKINSSFGRVATTPVSASVIGAIQVQEALKIIHENKDSSNGFKTLSGKLFKYDGLNVDARIIKLSAYEPDCTSHELWEPVIEIECLGADNTVSEALGIIKAALKEDQVAINLTNNVFVKSLIPEKTEEEFEVNLPESKVMNFLENNSLGINANEQVFQDFVEIIDDEFPLGHLTLNQIGIPYFDIIQVASPSGISYVELSKDRNLYPF